VSTKLVPLGLIVLGLLLLAGCVVSFVRAAGAPAPGEGREVLWYPTGAAAACAIYSKTYQCDSTPMGNVNEGGRVVARSVPLMASMDDFRWTVNPGQVEAANRRSRNAYLACVAADRPGCPEPVAKVPSWNSGMAARWDAGFDGAYPEGVDPRSRFAVAQLPWVLLVAGVVFLGWGGWLFANAPTVRAK
jgi:hypothetical protein